MIDGQAATMAPVDAAAESRERSPDRAVDADEERDRLIRRKLLRRAWALSRRSPYRCFLDEQPTDLVPIRARQALLARTANKALIVNPSFRYRSGGEVPDEAPYLRLPAQCFLPGFPLAWVQDPGARIWTPFWVRDDDAERLGSLRPGEPAPSSLDRPIRDTLALADILVPPDSQVAGRARWARFCRETAGQLRSRGYAIVHDLIHPFQVGAMRSYYRALLAQAVVPLGDGQVERRYAWHTELLGVFFHRQLADFASRIAGEPMKPSYTYFVSYQPGAVLERHLDREQCELTMSLLIDYAPEPESTSGWPLFLERSGGSGADAPPKAAAVDLGIGDALLFRGRELVHYRDALPSGHVSSSLLLHFVPSDFTGPLW